MGLLSDLAGRISPSKLGAMTSSISEADVCRVLSRVEDPDLKRDIVSLGFLKNIRIDKNNISVDVELTTPACPVKDLLKKQCEDALGTLPDVGTITVKMTAQTRGSKITSPNITASLGEVKNIIAVASAKGGVAKSTTAVNLAFALQGFGSRVGILDADVYGPSLPILTKVSAPTSANAQQMVIPPEVDGVKIMSAGMFGSQKGASILRGPMAGQVVKQFLSQIAWGALDYLIIDYPPGTGDIQLTISQVAPVTAAVLVTTPQEIALADVRKSVSMFETLKVPVLGLVETMSYFICDGCEKRHEIFKSGGGAKLAEELGIPLLAQIPIDPKVVTSSDSGLPIVQHQPTAAAAAAYLGAASELARHLSIMHSLEGKALSQFSVEWKN